MMQKSRLEDTKICMSVPDVIRSSMPPYQKIAEMTVPKYMEDGWEDDD
jgi:hypothetical protein